MIDLLDLLLEHDLILKHVDSGRCMIADEMYTLGGEFVVYKYNGEYPEDLYRGNDIEDALNILETGEK